MKTSYQSAVDRINTASTLAELARVEKGFARVYDAGQLTSSEVGRLFVISMEKAIALSEEQLDRQ